MNLISHNSRCDLNSVWSIICELSLLVEKFAGFYPAVSDFSSLECISSRQCASLAVRGGLDPGGHGEVAWMQERAGD